MTFYCHYLERANLINVPNIYGKTDLSNHKVPDLAGWFIHHPLLAITEFSTVCIAY